MASSASQNYFSADVLTRTGAALIVVTSATVAARFAIRIWKRKPFQIEDALVALAYASFLSLTISYMVITPPMYHLYATSNGDAPPYETMMDDAHLIIKVFFYSTILLWVTLWAVKFSLLALYRRLMTGLRSYVILWWALVVFCALTFVGAVISDFTSCSSMHAWFTPGHCATPRDIKAQIASLYYAFAVDVLTDLLIMALPIRLIWNLQMPRAEKIGIGALFCSGFVCIAVAIVRVIQIGVKANNSTPSSTWLALWAEVESAIAVVIGCCPAFAAFYRTKRNTSRGYSKPKENRSGPSQNSTPSRDDGIPLQQHSCVKSACTSAGGCKRGTNSSSTNNHSPTTSSRKGKASVIATSTYWEDGGHSSQEELARTMAEENQQVRSGGGIYVTRSIRQDSSDGREVYC